MAAVLDTSIIDSLLTTVDDIRGDLLPTSGLRAYRVFTVRRTWGGARRGEGSYVDVKTELLPSPAVTFQSRSYNLMPTGRHEESDATLTELSLAAYVEADLTGGKLQANEQFFYMLEDAHGQGVQPRAFHTNGAPEVDRVKGLGWRVYLKRAEGIV